MFTVSDSWFPVFPTVLTIGIEDADGVEGQLGAARWYGSRGEPEERADAIRPGYAWKAPRGQLTITAFLVTNPLRIFVPLDPDQAAMLLESYPLSKLKPKP